MPAPGIVVTRPEGPRGPLTRLLQERGFCVHHWPTIRMGPPADEAPLEQALTELESFDWIVFTSPRAVAAVVERLAGWDGSAAFDGREGHQGAGGVGAERIAERRRRPAVAAVGEATAAALRDGGWIVDLVPATQTGTELVNTLLETGLGRGTRVLFPASAIARDTVPAGLGEAGAVVIQVEAYSTRPAELDRDACVAALEPGDIAWVTFTSPSTVEGLERGLGRELFARLRERTRAVAIGPTTAEAAEGAGLKVYVAARHSLEGLADRAAAVAAATDIEER